jgi:hypothetical protein
MLYAMMAQLRNDGTIADCFRSLDGAGALLCIGSVSASLLQGRGRRAIRHSLLARSEDTAW